MLGQRRPVERPGHRRHPGHHLLHQHLLLVEQDHLTLVQRAGAGRGQRLVGVLAVEQPEPDCARPVSANATSVTRTRSPGVGADAPA